VAHAVVADGRQQRGVDEGDAKDRDLRPADDRLIVGRGWPLDREPRATPHLNRRYLGSQDAWDSSEPDEVGCGRDERQTPTNARAGEPTPASVTYRNETPARHLGEADPQVHAPHGHRVRRHRRGLPVEPGC
jgi:hypothetical protein